VALRQGSEHGADLRTRLPPLGFLVGAGATVGEREEPVLAVQLATAIAAPARVERAVAGGNGRVGAEVEAVGVERDEPAGDGDQCLLDGVLGVVAAAGDVLRDALQAPPVTGE
jgi:hypothetical protein